MALFHLFSILESTIESISEESEVYKRTLETIMNHAKVNNCPPDQLSFPSIDASFALLDDDKFE